VFTSTGVLTSIFDSNVQLANYRSSPSVVKMAHFLTRALIQALPRGCARPAVWRELPLNPCNRARRLIRHPLLLQSSLLGTPRAQPQHLASRCAVPFSSSSAPSDESIVHAHAILGLKDQFTARELKERCVGLSLHHSLDHPTGYSSSLATASPNQCVPV